MRLENGSYFVQNQRLTDLASQFGTPLYVYDGAKITEQIAALRDAFPGIHLKIKYACKALTTQGILQLMRRHGVDLDVVSPGELQMGLRAGYRGDQITFTPSGVSFDEIEAAVDAGAFVNLDNLDVLDEFGRRYGASKPCMIRIKPNVAAGGHRKIMTAHEESKFGIDIRQRDDILDLVRRHHLHVVGLHQHTGSDIKPAAAFEAAEKLFDLAYNFPDLRYIDLGGGFKVSYREGDPVTDIPAFGAEMTQFFQHFCQRYGRDLELWLEPGKFLVSEAGYLLATVNVVKPAPGRTFVGLNTGLNHLIRPMMYEAHHEIVNLSNSSPTDLETYDVVGYICETDTFAAGRTISRTSKGDVLAFKNAGAYGFTMASTYNARPRPAEVLVYENQAHLIRRRESVEDLLRNQVDVNL